MNGHEDDDEVLACGLTCREYLQRGIESRAAQGLPPQVEDAAALRFFAELLYGHKPETRRGAA